MDEEENLPNLRVRETLKQLFGHSDYRLDLACEKGDNYLGVIWRIHLPDGNTCVLKLPPQNSIRRKQFFARPCFIRESLAYEMFLPLIQSFQAKCKLPEVERFQHSAHCLGNCQDELNECIVLEDLCSTGYQLHDRFQELTPAHTSLVMCAYAKLHAVSLALKQQQPHELQPFQEMVDIFEQRRNDYALGIYFENLKQSALDALCPQSDAQYIHRLKNYFARGSYFDLLIGLVNGASCEPHAVVCHGDSWNNNLLYRCREGVPVEVRLIDWQLMRYASPISDLVYFLFTCTSQAFRKQHYKKMLELYYMELVKQLKRFGEDAERLLPRKEFEKQEREKGALGLLLAMMVLPIVTMRGDDVPDLQAISQLIEDNGTTNLKGAGFLGPGNEMLYKQRIRGVILDCVDYDYI